MDSDGMRNAWTTKVLMRSATSTAPTITATHSSVLRVEEWRRARCTGSGDVGSCASPAVWSVIGPNLQALGAVGARPVPRRGRDGRRAR